jgi:hypothetical protein
VSMGGDQAYADAVSALPPPRYALIDGGFFADLPAALDTVGLEGRGLYLELDGTARRAGPFLVPTPDDAAAARVLTLVGGRPAAPFWSWPMGARSLYEHLRRLTTADIPLAGGGHEPVLFRIADEGVLGIVAPVLTPEQRARLLGAQGAALLFRADGAPRLLERPAGAEPASGRLRLSAEQYRLVEERYAAALRERAVARFAPDIPGPPDRARARVLDAFARAEAYGLAEPDHILRFVGWDARLVERFELLAPFAEAYGHLTDRAEGPDLRLFYAERAIGTALTERGWAERDLAERGSAWPVPA